METSNDERERVRRQLYVLVYQPGLIPTKIVLCIYVRMRACVCVCSCVNVFALFACFCVHLAYTVWILLLCIPNPHQVVSVVVAEASTDGGEKLKGRRKSLRGPNKKDETEEMPRVHSADFAGLTRFCAPFYKHKRYCIFYPTMHTRKERKVKTMNHSFFRKDSGSAGVSAPSTAELDEAGCNS